MKTLFTIILSLFTYISMPVNSGIDIKEIDFDDEHRNLLYQIVFNEAVGEGTIGISMVIDVIRNRINHPDYPSTLDSVLLEPNQFSTIKSNPTKPFKALVDTLLTKPIVYPYIFFINPLKAKKASWMKRKVWVKHGKHSFAL